MPLPVVLLLMVSPPASGVEQAEKLFRDRQFVAAEKAFRQIVTVRPKDANVRLLLARTLIERDRIAEALDHIETALAGEPSPETRFRAGEILRSLAGRRFAELQKAAPASAAVREMAGNELARRGRLAQALTEYEAARKLEPGRPGIHYRLGTVLWRQRELEAAARELQAELDRSPHHAMANLYLGQVYLAQDEAGKAVPHLEAAVKAMPHTVEGRRELGKAYRKISRPEDARREWETVAKLRPEDDQVHFLLGTLYRELGMADASRAELAKHAAILSRRRARQ